MSRLLWRCLVVSVEAWNIKKHLGGKWIRGGGTEMEMSFLWVGGCCVSTREYLEWIGRDGKRMHLETST